MDASKEADNLRKHSVSFAEAVESFFDPNGCCSSTRNTRGGEPILLGRQELVGPGADDALHPAGYKGTHHRLAEWREFRRLYSEKAKHP